MVKIGIFGGSFNPPHNMHEQIAVDLIEKGYVDKVIFVPVGDKYQKSELVSAKDRYNMVSLMIEDNPDLLISDYEIKNVLTYTYQTLDYFKEQYVNDEIYFVCGSDNLLEITTWKNYQYILDNYKLLVIRRGEDNIDGLYPNIIVTDITMSNLSSTVIRNDLKNGKINDNINGKILKYILDKNLYVCS